jgi:hypothetical protein
MPRRRRVYILRIEDYLVEPPAPPSRLPRLVLSGAVALLAAATGVLAVGWVFALIPANVVAAAVPIVFGYGLILTLFTALARQINHVE